MFFIKAALLPSSINRYFAALKQTGTCLLVALLTLFFLQPPLSHALASEAVNKQTAWPHEQSDLAPDPALVFGQLDNGFRYVLLKNKEPKNRVSMHLNVQAGSLYEEDHEQGMAHFLEHMLFNGTTHFKPGELIKYFQSIGMQFGHDANARTGFYETVYDLMLPTGDKEQLDKGLLVFSDYAQGALLLPEEIEDERKVVLAEMRTRDSSSYRTFLATVHFELPGTRMVQRMPIGKKEVLETMDQHTIKAFYDKWYAPKNLILVMVGDFDPDIAAGLIKKHFSKMSPRKPAGEKPAFGYFEHKGLKTFYHHENEEGNTTVTIEIARKITPLNDSLELQKQKMVQKMAERIIGHRLEDMLREPDTPFSKARISSGYFFNQVFFAEITADCSPANWEKTLFRIEQVLRQALQFGFTEAELDRVKKEQLANLENQSKNMATRNSQRLAGHLLSSIADSRVFQAPDQRLGLFAPFVSQVTAEDLFNAMKDTWSPDHRLVLVTGNARLDQTGARPEDLIQSAYQKSTAVEIKPVEELSVRAFPYLPAVNKKGEIVNQTHLPEADSTQIDFKNNVRLNFKKTDFKANEVLISAAFGRGRVSEPQTLPGLSAITTGVINQSGLGQMPVNELSNALAGKKTSIMFRTQENHFSFEIKTTPDEIDVAFELLKAHFLDPAFREDAFSLVQKRNQQRYDMLFHSIDGAMELYAKRFLAGGDTRFGYPNQDQLNKVTLSDVKTWMAPVLAYAPIEVSVVGNFNSDDLISTAAQCLGTLPDREPENRAAGGKSPAFPSGKTKTVTVDTKIPKVLVIVAYPTDDMWNIHQTRVLSILAEIFSEKIRLQVREKLGVAYSPYVYNQPSRAFKNYGKLQAFIQTDPGSVELVIEEVKQIARNLAETGVTDTDVKYALDPMLTSLKDLKRKNEYWLKNVLTGSKNHPEQLQWSQSIIDDYAAISRKELTAAAKKFLNNDKAAVFVATPIP